MSNLLPLTEIQRRYIELFELAPQFRVNNIAVPYYIDAVFDEAAIRSALADLLAMHPLLRARVVRSGTDWAFDLAADVAPELTVQRVTAGELDAALAESTIRVNAVRLATDRAPMLAVEVIATGENVWGLVLCVHHLISDGLSIRILVRDLFLRYREALRGTVGCPPADGRLHRELADRERALICSDEGRRRMIWWRNQLGELLSPQEAVDDPYDAPCRVDELFPAGLAERLQSSVKQAGVSLPSCITAAGASTVPTSGRVQLVKRVITRRESPFEEVVDNCVDLQCLAYDGSAPVREQAVQLSGLSREAAKNALPIWWIMSEIAPQLRLTRCGPARIEINVFVPAPSRALDLPEICVTKAAEHALTTWPQYDYCFLVQPLLDAAWKSTLIYNPRCATDLQAKAMVEGFFANLERFCASS